MSDLSDSPRAAFDDDRLLDYALGIEDDPELAAALAQSAQLRERLADLKADLAAIEAELRQAIPAVDESYAEPSPARWPRLRDFFATDDAARRRPHGGRRLAAGFAAAALALAIIVGLVSVLPRMHNGSSGSTSAGSQPAAAPADRTLGSEATQGAVGAPVPQPTAGSAGTRLAPAAALAGQFRDVVVAQAGAVTGARQSFTVVKVLKGSVQSPFTLGVLPGTTPAKAGSLQVVYLRPKATSSFSGPSNANVGAVGATPSSSSTKGSAGGGAATTAYSYAGQRAFAAALAGGVDPSTVRLP